MGAERASSRTVRNTLDKTEVDRRATILVENCDGIYPPFEAFHILSVLYSTSRSLAAFRRYSSAISRGAGDDTIVSAVHEALGHAAALSRFFWPSRVEAKKSSGVQLLKNTRARKLRQAFDLNEDSPLKDRRLRNALEHFDERLDRYMLADSAGFFFPGPMVGDHQLADDPTGHIFKLVDPKAQCFVLLGEKFYFRPLRKEVSRVHRRANEMDRKGSRLRNDVVS